ncbi:MAG: hypothetical protein Kow0029_28390 [Candidatus Rifleibacteriota bacterium]
MNSEYSSAFKKKVLILDTDANNNDLLREYFNAKDEFELVGIYNSAILALQSLKSSPDIALVGMDIPNGIKFCQFIRQKFPNISIFLLTNKAHELVLDQVREAKALDSIIRGASFHEIDKTLKILITKPVFCSFVGVGGIKEGVGSTLLTSLLGDFLGRVLPDKVVLVDLVPRRGDLAFNFGLSSKKNIKMLLKEPDFLHPNTIYSYLQKTKRGFYILPSSQEPDTTPLDRTALMGLMTVLGNFFELVLLDLPPYPFVGYEEIIDICDSILINIGQTPNQLKLVLQMAHSDFKALPKTFTDKFSFVSWTMNKGAQSGITGVLPKTVFLPKPIEAMFSNPRFTIMESAQYEPLRKGIKKLLKKLPSVGLQLVSDSLEKDKTFWSFLESLFQKEISKN